MIVHIDFLYFNESLQVLKKFISKISDNKIITNIWKFIIKYYFEVFIKILNYQYSFSGGFLYS